MGCVVLLSCRRTGVCAQPCARGLLVDPRAVLPGVERTVWCAQDRCARRACRGGITAESDFEIPAGAKIMLANFPAAQKPCPGNFPEIPAGTKNRCPLPNLFGRRGANASGRRKKMGGRRPIYSAATFSTTG